MNKDKFFSYILLPAIIVAGAILRFISIGRESLWFDELFPLWVSSLPLKDLIVEGTASGHPQLYNLISYLWISEGSSDIWIRMISFISGVANIWLIYLIGKEYVSRRTGLWAAALAAFSPYLFYYSREATDKALSIAVTSASLYFLVRSVKRGGWANWSAYVLTTAAALFSHFYAVFLVVGEVLFYFVAFDRKQLRFRAWLTSQLALLLFTVLWFFSNRGSSRWVDFKIPGIFTVVQDVFYKGPKVLLGIVLPLNHGDVYIVSDRYLFIILAAGVLFIAGFMLYSRDFRSNILNRKTIALALLIVVAVAGPVISSLLRDYFTSVRYYAWGVVPFLLLLAILINALPRRLGAIAGSIVIICSLGTTIWSLHTYHYDNWRGIMSTISEEQLAGDKLLCYPLPECTMAAHHYLNDGPLFSGGFINNQDSAKFYPVGVVWNGYGTAKKFGEPVSLSGEELEDRINTDIEGAERVWVLSGDGSVERIKPAEAVEKILERDWHVERQTSYPPYLLMLYVLNS